EEFPAGPEIASRNLELLRRELRAQVLEVLPHLNLVRLATEPPAERVPLRCEFVCVDHTAPWVARKASISERARRSGWSRAFATAFENFRSRSWRSHGSDFGGQCGK